MALPALDSPIWQSSSRTFVQGLQSAVSSILGLVLFATFIGIGAFAHDAGFSLTWAVAGSVLIWAGPAQIILISTSHAGASLLESALAVTLSAIRLLPMVVVVLPMLRTRQTRMHQLALPAHISQRLPSGSKVCGCCRRCRATSASPSPTGWAPGLSRYA